MAIPVKLPVFEGPLDLLMHLIEKNKIDIYDIPIVEITDIPEDALQGLGSAFKTVLDEMRNSTHDE